jgi:hypothetical protein
MHAVGEMIDADRRDFDQMVARMRRKLTRQRLAETVIESAWNDFEHMCIWHRLRNATKLSHWRKMQLAGIGNPRGWDFAG